MCLLGVAWKGVQTEDVNVVYSFLKFLLMRELYKLALKATSVLVVFVHVGPQALRFSWIITGKGNQERKDIVSGFRLADSEILIPL